MKRSSAHAVTFASEEEAMEAADEGAYKFNQYRYVYRLSDGNFVWGELIFPPGGMVPLRDGEVVWQWFKRSGWSKVGKL